MNRKDKKGFGVFYKPIMKGLRQCVTMEGYFNEERPTNEVKAYVCLNCLRDCVAKPYKNSSEDHYVYFSDCCTDKVVFIDEEMDERERVEQLGELLNKDFLFDLFINYLHEDFESRGDYYINEMEKIRDILSGFSKYAWEDRKEIENQIEKMDQLRAKVRRERVLLAFKQANEAKKNGKDGK